MKIKHNADGNRWLRSLARPTHVFASLALFLLVLPAFAATARPQSSSASPDEVRKLIKKAVKLTRAESLAESEKVLRHAIELDPNSSAAKVELAYSLCKQRRLIDAYNLVFPVAEAEKTNARAFSVLGTVLLTGGRFKEARAVFFAAIKIDRRQHLAWAGYGLLDFYENRITDAILNLNEAVLQGPNEPDHAFALAQVSSRAERYSEAADAYRRFLNISSLTDKDRRARIVSLINFLRYLGQQTGLYKHFGAEQTEVPFDLEGNRPVIDVKINGSDKPFRFVLDTGSGISVISDRTAKALRIKPITRGGFAKGIGGDGKFEIVYGFLREMEIGKVALRSVPVYIREFHNSSQVVDGYLGLSLISKFLTTVDYGNKTFALSRREDDRREFIENESVSLPLRLTSSGFLSGEVMLEGIDVPLNFIVDTGASVSVISDRVANNKGIVPYANVEKLRVIGAAGITEDVPTYMLPRVTFGPHTRKQVTAVALDLDLINEASGFEQAGILGGNFLKNYRLTFDFRNSKVVFTSVNPEN
ncbi:MAG: aspartyl protease family protein [Pyrinomonadaceae bacterium]|nr:aspartyl protease family protein [Pyrinomonadaceae bacterium]MBP6212128.1 aspartyl protease family protein [Pyrinomonadaceae bacterium]